MLWQLETIEIVTLSLQLHLMKVHLGNQWPFDTGNLVYLSLHLSVLGWHVNVYSLIHRNVHLIVRSAFKIDLANINLYNNLTLRKRCVHALALY